MFKDLVFDNLPDLIKDFLHVFESVGHVVCRISLSLPVEHDVHHPGYVGWNCCVLDQKQLNTDSFASVLNDFVDRLPNLVRRFRRTGRVPLIKKPE